MPDNTVVASFEYRKDSKHASSEPNSPIVYRSCKLSKINADGLGSVSSNTDAVLPYRSAFFLSQIKMPDNTVVASFEYRK
ncbi:hypothetical protein, partial [Chryseobacterium sp. CH1]|uniref:hypothetical protein n=1 Tax=Chryseobacterium sp. CH1 TaxID=713551 RepID=UPI001E3148A2